MRTSLCVGQCVMMIDKVISAGSRNGLQLMIGKPVAIVSAGCGQSVQKDVIRIIHLIHAENGLQATFIKAGIVRHKRQPIYLRRNLLPDIGEYRRIVRIFLRKTVYALAKPLIILRFRVNKAVKRVYNLTAPYDHDTNAADAGGLLIRRFEIYGRKIGHVILCAGGPASCSGRRRSL